MSVDFTVALEQLAFQIASGQGDGGDAGDDGDDGPTDGEDSTDG